MGKNMDRILIELCHDVYSIQNIWNIAENQEEK